MNDGLRLTEAAGESPRKGAALDRLRAVWSRRKWLAILAFAVPATAAASLVSALPNIYRATATVLVEGQQVPEAFVRSTITSELETRLHTISQEILSRSRLETLITRFGLYPDLRKRVSSEEVVERMRSDVQLQLKASNARGRATTAFALSYSGRDPQTVALVTNTLASFYIEENLKLRERQATGTAEFLKSQLSEAKSRLEQLESRLSEFRKRHLGELPHQMQANLTTLEVLSTQLRLSSDSQVRAQERREALKTQLAEAASFPLAPILGAGSGPPLEPDAVRLVRLKQELTAARIRYTDENSAVVRLRAEIAALELELAPPRSKSGAAVDSPPSLPPSPYVLRLREALQAVDAEIRILKGEEDRLRQAIGAYRTRVENTPAREQELQDLTRDYDLTKELYQSLVKRHEDAQLAESMEQRQKGEQFRVLDPAIPSETPAAPNRQRLLVMSLGLAIALTAGVVLLAEMLDTSFHSVGELRAFTIVPVLASIPRIRTDADGRRQRWRFRLAAVTVVLALVVLAGGVYLGARGNERLAQMFVRDRV
jgi:polysaccharide chain length determinant protein (PEP-CTERM system associated)